MEEKQLSTRPLLSLWASWKRWHLYCLWESITTQPQQSSAPGRGIEVTSTHPPSQLFWPIRFREGQKEERSRMIIILYITRITHAIQWMTLPDSMLLAGKNSTPNHRSFPHQSAGEKRLNSSISIQTLSKIHLYIHIKGFQALWLSVRVTSRYKGVLHKVPNQSPSFTGGPPNV